METINLVPQLMTQISNQKLAMKCNSILKKTSIKNVQFVSFISEETTYKDITLIIRPDWQTDYFFPKKVNQVHNAHPTEFWKELAKKGGWREGDFMPSVLNIDASLSSEEITPITMDYKTSKVVVGYHMKNRNILTIQYPIYESNLSLELKNELITEVFKKIADYCLENKVEAVDVSPMATKYMLRKFYKEANNQIISRSQTIHIRENNIEGYYQSIINEQNTLDIDKTILNSLTSFLKEKVEVFTARVNEIKTLPFVKDILLTERGIFVDVGDITINETYIGKFSVRITPSVVSAFNRIPKDNHGDIYHHPHISSEGSGGRIAEASSICFGNERKKIIIDLLHKKDFKKLVYMVYLFLKSYTDGDNYCTLERFSEMTKTLEECSIDGKYQGVADEDEPVDDDDWEEDTESN